MIAIIVPTVNRANMLEALVANIHDVTETEHEVWLVMEYHDKPSLSIAFDLAFDLDVTMLVGEFGSCSRAVNAGYRASTAPFVAVVNDDVVFHPGWDTNALKYFDSATHIVGMNDGYGDCKSFAMVRREFIEQHSGVYDRENTVFHEGYQSQGPDTELAFYAMLRGVWAAAPDSIVQHVNWRTGADPNHPNYQKARDVVSEDVAEYLRRWPEWDPGQVMPPPIPTVPSSR